MVQGLSASRRGVQVKCTGTMGYEETVENKYENGRRRTASVLWERR